MQHQGRRMAPKGSEYCRPDSPAKTLSSFYTIIFPSILEDKKLRIPEKFVEKHGNELSTVAMLTCSNGTMWHVGLYKADEKVWFHYGWQQFVKHHSIDCWYFLLFKYTGNSNFNVIIFDMTACEVHHLCTSLSSPKDPKESNEGRKYDDEIVEISGFPLPNSTLGHNKHHKRAASSENLKSKSQCLRRSQRHKMGDHEKINEVDNVLDISLCGRDLQLSGSRINDCSKKDTNDVQVATQRSIVLYHQFSDSKCTKAANEDGQKILVKNEEHVGLLGIDTSPRAYPKRRLVTAQESERAINAARMFEPENPSYTVILRRYNVYHNFILIVSAKFAVTCLNKVSESIKLQVCDGREWLVRCIHRYGRVVSLSKGWRVFARENHLAEGDVCVFELTPVKDVLKVSIFRTAGDPSEMQPNLLECNG